MFNPAPLIHLHIFIFYIKTPGFNSNTAEVLGGFYADLPNAFHSVPTGLHKTPSVLNINEFFVF
jgi:hypothetical protein